MSGRPWLLTRKHPPSVGGMQQLSFQLASGLQALRPVTVIAWRRGQWGLPFFFLIAFVRLLPALVRKQVSVLHLGDPALAALAWLPRLFGVPVVATVHGLDITWPAAAYQLYLRLFFWRRMDAYACISRHVRDVVLAAGIADDKVLVIPLGVDALPGSAAEPDLQARLQGRYPVLLALGRLVERKGLPWFLREVAPSWLAHHPDATLVIAGGGPMQASVLALVAEHDLHSQVIVCGPVSDARKSWLLERCDLVLMPNINVPGDAEGFGLVALEAASAGRWVLASDLQGLRDAVTPDRNGSLVEPGNVEAWSDALDRSCADHAALRGLGRQAQAFVSAQFSWATMVARYDRLFRSLESDVA